MGIDSASPVSLCVSAISFCLLLSIPFSFFVRIAGCRRTVPPGPECRSSVPPVSRLVGGPRLSVCRNASVDGFRLFQRLRLSKNQNILPGGDRRTAAGRSSTVSHSLSHVSESWVFLSEPTIIGFPNPHDRVYRLHSSPVSGFRIPESPGS